MCWDRIERLHDGGTTKIKVTLDGSLVYYFDVCVGDQAGQEAILGMYFMVPAGIRFGSSRWDIMCAGRSPDRFGRTETTVQFEYIGGQS